MVIYVCQACGYPTVTAGMCATCLPVEVSPPPPPAIADLHAQAV